MEMYRHIYILLCTVQLLSFPNAVLCNRRVGYFNTYNKGCSSGNILINIGLHSMWQPLCKSRRQDDDMSNYKWPPDPGPIRRPEYDPTWGYEPYWETGDWVFEAGPWLDGKVCGQECPQTYIQFGKICGRSMDRKFKITHQTFDNYCEMQKIDCDGAKVTCYVLVVEAPGLPSGYTLPPGVTLPKDKSHYLEEMDDTDPNYNPNYGYEPYWPQGEWVFELPRNRDPNATTTKIPTVCGEECHYLYTKIGNICAHISDYTDFDGCHKNKCDGWLVDDLSKGFITYRTYCEFLDHQCKSNIKSRPIFVHVGKCIKPQELWYKKLNYSGDPVTRLDRYMDVLHKVFQNISETPFKVQHNHG